MDRPRIIRLLRIAVSTVGMISFVIFVLLWVSSHLRVLILVRDTGSDDVALASLPGELNWMAHKRPRRRQTSAQWGFGTERITKDWKYPIKYNGKCLSSTIGFRWRRTTNERLVSVPYWFLVSLSAIFAVAPWSPWSSRFSLRTLLIATTLVAALLGAVVFAK